MLESELAATGELDRIVFGAVGRMRVDGTPKDEGAVEHVAVATSVTQTLEEVRYQSVVKITIRRNTCGRILARSLVWPDC